MPSIVRLSGKDAEAIGHCFRRVYGETYGNPLFYDLVALETALDSGALSSVGAWDDDGDLIAHMAMTSLDSTVVAELGNTVVDPRARGGGLAWQVGAALISWCVEKGFRGYLHYSTTDHHIMQQQSVKSGFETGVMLGYIPAETAAA